MNPSTIMSFRNELAELGPKGVLEKVEPAGLLMAGPGAAAEQVATLTLTPGEYQVVCFVPTPTDGMAHFAHGMQRTITVG